MKARNTLITKRHQRMIDAGILKKAPVNEKLDSVKVPQTNHPKPMITKTHKQHKKGVLDTAPVAEEPVEEPVEAVEAPEKTPEADAQAAQDAVDAMTIPEVLELGKDTQSAADWVEALEDRV